MMAREFWMRSSAGASGDEPARLERLAAKFDELAERIARLEEESERMSAQILFTEKALSTCLERETLLRRTQDALRIELLSKVHGLTTE